LKMAGAGEGLVETQSLLKSTRIRLPWLLASWIGGVIAFFIIGYFETSLNKLVYLAAFIPIIMGMGGNIGTQSSTIVVRGLATGQLNLKQTGYVVSKELAIGFLLGFVYGLLLGLVVQLRYELWFGVTVGLAVLSSMTIAALVGSLVPMVFARINIDPAVATGPFVTTSIDILSVFFYFQIATMLLHL
jgi:magnesium transporter